MKKFMQVPYDLVTIIVFSTLLSGCAGLSQQYKASTEGIAFNYAVNKEKFVHPNGKVVVASSDERIDKDVIGDGAKPTVGTRFMGYIAFGVIYAAMPDQPAFREQDDPVRIFRTAIAERLSKNGITIINNKEDDAIAIDLFVRQLKLDFNFGKWSGEVGYIARVKKNGDIICESSIFEKANAFNLYGFGSGEKAINEAFNNAINRFDINSCFLKLQK